VADPERLVRAWEVVRRNDDADGVRSGGVDRFADDLTANLERVAAQLAAGTYAPGPLAGVDIPKSGGGRRRLKVPVVADRVVERALAEVIGELVDPWLSPWSMGYRQGLSIGDAHRLLAAERDAGATHVLRSDLTDCFDGLDRARVVGALAGFVDDPAVLELVERLCARPAWWRGSLRVVDRGVAQGSPLSPLLCNLYLDELDRALAAHGIPAVRFADDLALPAGSADDAARALRRLTREVARVGLELNEDKTEVMSFAEGFAFLGEEFTDRYPSAEAERQQPDRRTLYVGRQGAGVHLSQGKLVVSRDDEDLLAVPVTQVGRVVLFGAVGLSAGARSHVLYQKVPVVLLSRRGNYLGRLDGSGSSGAAARRRQYAASADPAERLAVAKSIVGGKVANQRALLHRYGGGSDEPEEVGAAADELRRLGGLAADCEDVGQLLGMEGAAAKRYFDSFARLLPEGYEFPGRRRRPATDVVNSMLSFGYACLTGEAVGAVAAAGLDPGIGLLHADADRPSLALDLIEEFRPVVVDTVVLNCARRALVPADATKPAPDGEGVFLTDAARHAFLSQLEERMLTLFGYTVGRSRVSYRRALHLQARQLSVLLRSGPLNGPDSDAYRTIRWR
jgi:CRISP-associated protein Cas1